MAEEQRLDAQWFVLWTHSHCEQIVRDQLASKGYEVFLPMMKIWSRKKGERRAIAVPMFAGYAFVHHTIDKWAYVELLKTRGLVRILGERWDRLVTVPDHEVEAIRRVSNVDVPVMPCPYLREGERVRITDGALTGVEGLLVHVNRNKGLLVLSVDLLQRSVAVEVDCTQVTPLSVSATISPRTVGSNIAPFAAGPRRAQLFA